MLIDLFIRNVTSFPVRSSTAASYNIRIKELFAHLWCTWYGINMFIEWPDRKLDLNNFPLNSWQIPICWMLWGPTETTSVLHSTLLSLWLSKIKWLLCLLLFGQRCHDMEKIKINLSWLSRLLPFRPKAASLAKASAETLHSLPGRIRGRLPLRQSIKVLEA